MDISLDISVIELTFNIRSYFHSSKKNLSFPIKDELHTQLFFYIFDVRVLDEHALNK